MKKFKIVLFLLKATSPSPVASLDSSFENLAASDENDMPVDKNNSIISANNINNSSSLSSHINATSSPPPPPTPSIMSLKDYFLRHKSVDNCFPPHAASNAERIYFFDDEIKKLTNHLFEITTNHYPDRNNNNNSTETLQGDKIDVVGKEKLPSLDGRGNNNNNNNQFSAIFKKFTELADSGSASFVTDTSSSSQVPWAVTKRTKFKFNQTSSRDVPIVRTEKPARLKKQNAIDDATDMKLFDENISHKPVMKSIVDIFDENFDDAVAFQSRFRHETFVSRLPNGSISFDCGQLGAERSMNTIRALFQIHASTGTSVKNILGQIEAKNKS